MRRDFAIGFLFACVLIWLLTRPDTPRADNLRVLRRPA